jgi:hypothetical protein
MVITDLLASAVRTGSVAKLASVCEASDARTMAREGSISRTTKSANEHDAALTEIVGLIEGARRRAARMVNATMTAVYWSIGRRIVLEEQRGTRRAEYGEELIEQLARRLTAKFGRGFGHANLWQMRAFYLAYAEILQTLSGESGSERGAQILQTVSGESDLLASVAAGNQSGAELRSGSEIACAIMLPRPHLNGGVLQNLQANPVSPCRP